MINTQYIATVAIVTLAAISGCSGSGGRADEDLGGLVVAPAAEQDRAADAEAAATDPAELLRAAQLPHHQLAAVIGEHSFRGSSKLRVTESGEPVEQLDDTTSIDYRADGAFRALLDNSRDYGRHAIFVDGLLYLRPRYGRYHRRAPTSDDEPARLRDDIFGTFGAYFELVAPAVQVADGGTVDHHGRPAHKLLLSRASTADKRSKEPRTERAWREQVSVTAVTGELLLDSETGGPLHATLAAKVQFVRDGRTFAMELEVTHDIADIGTTADITAPADDQIVDTPHSSREADQREHLLKGLAAPARAAPTPTNPSGAAEP